MRPHSEPSVWRKYDLVSLVPSPQQSTSAKLALTASSKFFRSTFSSELVTNVTGLLLSLKTQSTVFLTMTESSEVPSEVILRRDRGMWRARERWQHTKMKRDRARNLKVDHEVALCACACVHVAASRPARHEREREGAPWGTRLPYAHAHSVVHPYNIRFTGAGPRIL